MILTLLRIDRSGVAQKTAYDLLLKLIARRAHTEAELQQKLQARGFDAQTTQEAIDRARDLKLLEDERDIALRYARTLAEKPSATPVWVTQKLMRRGIPEALIDAVVHTTFEAWDPQDAALRVIEGMENVPKAARKLNSLGFPAEVIAQVLQRDENAD